ncbi:B12-binding domain-containing protein [Nocardioides sp. J2M5]|uniref:cobalamin B12-binding domain-containing protein n=1 Tax=Nocardioides palaemonis TaxID=2829810 RepID=UPI001BA8C380|nr:B12-binding domain-containing protein [Nocardioides palaemonis]MBS2939599.1 B12-binding domain-containing protein [Nocardioides palaemonis]
MTTAPAAPATAATERLWAAVETYDGEVADTTLADMLWQRSLADAITTVVLPFLEELGDRWEEGRLSVAHEHFVSNLLRRWLWAFAGRPTPEGAVTDGPVVLLACPPGERHDLVLLSFSLLLGEGGARTRYLGADTPMPAIVAAARAARADAVVLAATRDTAFTAESTAISRLAVEHPVFVAGRGASQNVAESLHAHLMPHDPVAAVSYLTTVLAR